MLIADTSLFELTRVAMIFLFSSLLYSYALGRLSLFFEFYIN